jgi:hypothetical protein
MHREIHQTCFDVPGLTIPPSSGINSNPIKRYDNEVVVGPDLAITPSSGTSPIWVKSCGLSARSGYSIVRHNSKRCNGIAQWGSFSTSVSVCTLQPSPNGISVKRGVLYMAHVARAVDQSCALSTASARSYSATARRLPRAMIAWPSASSLAFWASTPPGYFSLRNPPDLRVRQ